MDHLIKRTKSKTHMLNTTVLVLGFLQLNLDKVQDALGDWYGWIFIAIGVAGLILREITTKPISEK